MKKYLIILLFFCFSVMQIKSQDITSNLKEYTFVMLKTGPNRTQSAEEAAAIQKAHLNHLSEMAALHKLNVVGPFPDEGDWRGILIFNIPDTTEVSRLVSGDPAVKAGQLSFEIHPQMTQKGVIFE